MNQWKLMKSLKRLINGIIIISRLYILGGDDKLAKHEFGIIDAFEENKWYSEYEPEKYNCISISDDIIEELIIKFNDELMTIKTYFQVATQPGTGLDYCGITIIPPDSLRQFRDIIIKANSQYQSQELKLLIEKVSDAMSKNKYLIHYGI